MAQREVLQTYTVGSYTIKRDVLSKLAMAYSWILLVASLNPNCGALVLRLWSQTVVVIRLLLTSAF